MAWVIVGILTVGIFAVTAVSLSKGLPEKRKKGNEGRPGYQDVIVRNAVDINSQKFVSSTGQHFPNIGGIQSTPTVMSGDNLKTKTVVLYDLATQSQYNCSFSRCLVIGRDPVLKNGDNRFVINDELISKSHCRLQSDGQMMTITDLGSKNGTFLNGKRIENTASVNSGDRISIGGSSFTVRL